MAGPGAARVGGDVMSGPTWNEVLDAVPLDRWVTARQVADDTGWSPTLVKARLDVLHSTARVEASRDKAVTGAARGIAYRRRRAGA